jgi:hypothetical protein
VQTGTTIIELIVTAVPPYIEFNPEVPVGKPFVFISCGQITDAERRLGNQIAHMVRTLTDFEPFFAEEVQDLNGLDANILTALQNCVGFITVLHPRGTIIRPDKSVHTRGSVWIEQEIAIATYIQRVEKRSLPIIAFKHGMVGREGIRDLIQLNPIDFTDESEVLAALAERLPVWKSLKASSGIRVELASIKSNPQQGHAISTLRITLVNDTSRRISTYTLEVSLPDGLLRHWSATYPAEVPRTEAHHRLFRFDEQGRGVLNPRGEIIVTFDYCTNCSAAEPGVSPAQAGEALVSVRAWVEDREYSISKTISQLSMER